MKRIVMLAEDKAHDLVNLRLGNPCSFLDHSSLKPFLPMQLELNDLQSPFQPKPFNV